MNQTNLYKKHITIDGKIYKRDTSYYDVNEYCHDCGIPNKRGNVHMLGCDIEMCPKCKWQLMSCECDGKPKQVDILDRIRLDWINHIR